MFNNSAKICKRNLSKTNLTWKIDYIKGGAAARWATKGDAVVAEVMVVAAAAMGN